MNSSKFYIVNAITLCRLVAAPILLLLAISNLIYIFKYLLIISFFSDAIDGFLARKYKVVSRLGSKLDSIADDITVAVAGFSLFLYKPNFIYEQLAIIIPLLLLYIVQTCLALIRYGRISGFHTYLAKTSSLLQGMFLVLSFFTEPIFVLFYVAAFVTVIGLIEEIILVFLLSNWQVNIKGIILGVERDAFRLG